MSIWNRFFPGEDPLSFDRHENESEEEYKARTKANHEELAKKVREDYERNREHMEEFGKRLKDIKKGIASGSTTHEQAAEYLRQRQQQIEDNMNSKNAKPVRTDWGASYKDANGNYYDRYGNLLE